MIKEMIMNASNTPNNNTYTVKSGDTLGKIALHQLGESQRYQEIMALNGIENSNLIQVGQVLKLPSLTNQQDEKNDDMIEQGISFEQLKKITPHAKEDNLNTYLPAINNFLHAFDINTPLRLAHFIAQIAHESGSFNYKSENLNYSAKSLVAVFGKYFDSEKAEKYARQPEKIANCVYAERMGNGEEEKGDGWMYRGRGLIQLTGRENYCAAAKAIGLSLEENPDQVAEDPSVAVQVAAWYWQSHKLNKYADDDDLRQITRRINGAYNGLEDRALFLERAKSVLMS
jgi:putative chitinase